MNDLIECYRMLGLAPGASEEEVKRARMFLIETWHPDRLAHKPSVQKEAEEKLKKVNVAFDIIMNSLAAKKKDGSISNRATSEKGEPHRETVATINDSLVRDILNAWSIEKNKGVKYLGAFADDIVTSSSNAIKVVITTTTINREKDHRQRPGNEYRESDEREGGLFEYRYHNKNGKLEDYSLLLSGTVKTFTCYPSIICEVCRGSGKCQQCRGRGDIPCETCSGRGVLRGTKKVYSRDNNTPTTINEEYTCYSCKGTGVRKCSSCQGYSSCRVCSGQGKVKCDKCNGTGYYQDYDAIVTKFSPEVTSKVYFELSYLNSHLQDRTGNLIYDDIVSNWKNENEQLINNIDIIRNYSNEKNINVDKLIENILQNTKGVNQRIAQVSVKLFSVPVVAVNYKFEGKPYKLFILGNDHFVFANKLPDQHSIPPPFWSDGFVNRLKSHKTTLAFIYLAAYLLKSAGQITAEGNRHLEMLSSYCEHSEKRKNKLLARLIDHNIECSEVLKTISKNVDAVRFVKDANVQIYGWYLINIDGKVSDERIKAYNCIFNKDAMTAVISPDLKNKAVNWRRLDQRIVIDNFIKLRPRKNYVVFAAKGLAAVLKALWQNIINILSYIYEGRPIGKVSKEQHEIRDQGPAKYTHNGYNDKITGFVALILALVTMYLYWQKQKYDLGYIFIVAGIGALCFIVYGLLYKTIYYIVRRYIMYPFASGNIKYFKGLIGFLIFISILSLAGYYGYRLLSSSDVLKSKQETKHIKIK